MRVRRHSPRESGARHAALAKVDRRSFVAPRRWPSQSWVAFAENSLAGPRFQGSTLPLSRSGVFAEFETNLRRERQLEGISKAKAAGVYKGRPASIDAAQVRAMKAEGLGASEIAKALKIGRASVYRVLEAG